jgi:two-component system sensor histidine kinase PhoQ
MRSLNARVALSAGIVLAVFIALAAFALDQAFRDSARGAREERLLAQVYLLMSAAEVDARGTISIANAPLEPRFDMPQSGLYAIVIDRDGRVVWRSPSALSVGVPYGRQLPAGVHEFEEVKDAGGHPYFLQTFGVSWATSAGSYPFTFSVVEDLRPFAQQLSAYRKNLWGWLGATAVLLLIAQSFTLRWGLRPLRRLADEVSRLEHGERSSIEGDYPAEVKGVTDNLNALLAHERARRAPARGRCRSVRCPGRRPPRAAPAARR